MRRAGLPAALSVLLMVCGPTTAAGPRAITAETLAAVQAWTTFVERHVPGRRDAPVEAPPRGPSTRGRP